MDQENPLLNIEAKRVDIERRRSDELSRLFGFLVGIDAPELFSTTNSIQRRLGVSYNKAYELFKQQKEINDKYNAELTAL